MVAPPRKPLKKISDKRLQSLGGKTPFSSIPKRSESPRKRNPKRKASEFKRCYGSKERVLFVKGLGCLYCRMTFGQPVYPHVHNAHTENGGSGRKAGYETIIPLCATHHQAYDERRPPLASEFIRGQLKAGAIEVEQLWLSRIQEREE